MQERQWMDLPEPPDPYAHQTRDLRLHDAHRPLGVLNDERSGNVRAEESSSPQM
jgi:hypothetical protein